MMAKKRKARKKESLKAEGKVDKEKAQSKQLLVMLVIIAIILVITATFYILIQKSKKFDYYGFKFEYIMYDKLPLYYSKMTMERLDGSLVNYNLYLRNDPRENDIPVNAVIRLKSGNTYVTADAGIGKCEDSNLALINLGSFFSGLNIKAKGATSDIILANQTGHLYITCSDALNHTVISIETADKTGISQENNCYILKIKDCNILNVTEKFITEILRQKIV